MLLGIIRWLMGYVIFIVRGGFSERFVNLAVRDGISLWDLKKESGDLLGKVIAGEYRGLKRIAKKSGSQVRVKKKYGLPFILFKYRKRKGIVIGVISFMVIIYALSSYIWSVDVSGNVLISSEEVIQVMKELGVSPGTLRSRIDVPYIQHSAMIKLPATAWLSVNLNGSCANISIKEKIPAPNIISEDKPCNIKAALDGQIDRVEAYNGTAAVNAGDAVLKGQLLISGIVENSLGANSFVHSDGKVYAYTKRSLTEKSELNQLRCVDTGKVIKRYRVRIFGIEIPFSLWYKTDENYREEFYVDEFCIGNVKLPLVIYRQEWHEQACEDAELTYEQALEQAKEKIEEREKNDFKEITIINKDINAHEENGVCIVKANYLCREDIAFKEEIVFE